MKGMQGLLVAIGLGLVGAMWNAFYLSKKAGNYEKESFVGVAVGANLRQGDTFRESHLVRVDVPKAFVGALAQSAIRWELRSTVIGMNAATAHEGGEILLQQDLKQPPQKLELAENERALGIPVDNKTFVPTFVEPSVNEVTFMVPKFAGLARAPTGPGDAKDKSATKPTAKPPDDPNSSLELIGPFRVIALGNRMGSPDVMRGARMQQVQENVMTIAVRMEGDEMEPKARRLWDALVRNNFKQVGVLLHGQKKKIAG